MTPRQPVTARQKIDKLAESIADQAAGDGISLEERVEALKALTGYLGIVQKGRGKQDDEPADGVDFESFRLAAAGEAGPEGTEDGSTQRGSQARAHTGRRQRVRDIRAGNIEPN